MTKTHTGFTDSKTIFLLSWLYLIHCALHFISSFIHLQIKLQNKSVFMLISLRTGVVCKLQPTSDNILFETSVHM